MATVRCPGVYREDVAPAPVPQFRTGVPVFLGYASTGPVETPVPVMQWSQYVSGFGSPSDTFLGWSVRGFFDNEGTLAYVVRLNDSLRPVDALRAGLDAIASLEAADLVCAPDVMRTPADAVALQGLILEHCAAGGSLFAILDALRGAGLRDAVSQWQNLKGVNAALYHPWVRVLDPSGVMVPPCGHVAGIYSRTDRATGVFKSPANEEVWGITDVESGVTAEDQVGLDPEGSVNCLRSFPGRGIRVWGAHTISGQPDWKYVAVRRLYLTIARWVGTTLPLLVMEPNGPELWARIRREVNGYLTELFHAGAFRGQRPEEAFFVKCSAETTGEALREAGGVGVEVGFAPASPNEFVIVRFVHDAPQQK